MSSQTKMLCSLQHNKIKITDIPRFYLLVFIFLYPNKIGLRLNSQKPKNCWQSSYGNYYYSVSKSRPSVYFNSKLMWYIFSVKGRVSVYLRFGWRVQLLAAPLTVIKAFPVLRACGCVNVGMRYFLWYTLNAYVLLCRSTVSAPVWWV